MPWGNNVEGAATRLARGGGGGGRGHFESGSPSFAVGLQDIVSCASAQAR